VSKEILAVHCVVIAPALGVLVGAFPQKKEDRSMGKWIAVVLGALIAFGGAGTGVFLQFQVQAKSDADQ
jgi:hypothetical protein